MRTGIGYWAMFVVFGALIWLAGTAAFHASSSIDWC